MVFKCQEDSFLKEFTSKVVSCEPATLKWTPSGENKEQLLKGFNVILENTILFPDGGGQTCDYGTIDDLPVRNVFRKGSEAVHFVESSESLEEGKEVKIKLDWERRVDHMQQHSGQHLITALFDRDFNYDTTSWWLGTDICNIELATPHLISRESLELIERTANALILEGRAVSVMLMDPEVAVEFQDARAPRGLPKDHVGQARVVRIDGIESNMCCGTHVSNLSQLQTVKLLYAEKQKNKVNVYFVVGQRVLKKLGECYQREQQLNLALKGGPTQHLELVQKLQNNFKNAQKSFQKLLKDIAIAESDKLDNLAAPLPKFYTLHRQIGIEPDLISTFLRNAPEDIFYFLTVSESNGKGHMVLRGEPALIQKFGPLFVELLEGKGNGKEKYFQAKISDTSRIDECEALLEKHFNPPKKQQFDLIE